MSKLLALLVSVVASAFFVAPAFATDGQQTPATGWIEVCKAASPAGSLSDSFRFEITAANFDYTTNAATDGSCTLPIQVPAGYVTVHELATLTPDGHGGQFSTYDYTAVSAIHTSAPGGPDAQLNSVDLTGRSAVVTVNASDYVSDETIVTVTNDPVQGYVEVCKSQTSGAGLAGMSFPFTITGGNGFSQTASVMVDSCSQPILAPAGHVIVQETGAAIYVAGITSPTSSLMAPASPTAVTDPLQVAAGWAGVSVMQNGTVSEESIVNYENNASQLKLCKFADTGSESLLGQTFHFTVNGKPVSVVAGTDAEGMDSSHCVIVGSYPAGTQMNVIEQPMAGTQVSHILTTDSRPFIQGGSDFTGVSASFTLQAGVTTMAYVDKLADPGLLKVCKEGPAGEPAVQVDVTGPRGTAPHITTGTDTLTVPVGACVLDPNLLPYAGVQTVTEHAQTGYAVSGATVDDSTLLASALSGNSIGAYVGNAAAGLGTAVVTFTNVAATAAPATDDPPAGAAAPAAAAGGSGGGGGAPASPAAPAAAPAQAPAPAAVTPAVAKTKAIVKSTLSSTRIVNHRLIVRVVGSASKATIRVTLYGKNGKVLRSVLRSVHTNRAVTVPNLKLNSAVHHLKVKVL